MPSSALDRLRFGKIVLPSYSSLTYKPRQKYSIFAADVEKIIQKCAMNIGDEDELKASWASDDRFEESWTDVEHSFGVCVSETVFVELAQNAFEVENYHWLMEVLFASIKKHSLRVRWDFKSFRPEFFICWQFSFYLFLFEWLE